MRIISTVAVIAALATPAAALQVVNVLGQHSTPLNSSVLTNGAPYFDEDKDNQLGFGFGAPFQDEEKDNQLGLAANFGAPFVNQEQDDQRGYGADASTFEVVSNYGAPFVNEEKDNQLGFGFGAPTSMKRRTTSWAWPTAMAHLTSIRRKIISWADIGPA